MKWSILLFSMAIVMSCGVTKSVTRQDEYFGTDFSGFRYVVTEDRLNKIDTAGQVAFVYPLPRVTEYLDIDIVSPFKTILFYRDFNLLDILDDELNFVQTINLQDLEIGWVDAICSDYRGGYWLYSTATSKLYHFSYELDLLLEIETFRFLDRETKVKSMTWSDNEILLLTDNEVIVLAGSGVWQKNCPIDHPDADKIYQRSKTPVLIEKNEEYPVPCVKK